MYILISAIITDRSTVDTTNRSPINNNNNMCMASKIASPGCSRSDDLTYRIKREIYLSVEGVCTWTMYNLVGVIRNSIKKNMSVFRNFFSRSPNIILYRGSVACTTIPIPNIADKTVQNNKLVKYCDTIFNGSIF